MSEVVALPAEPHPDAMPPAEMDEVWLSILAHREGLPLPGSAAALLLGVRPAQMSQEARLSAIALTDRVIAALTAVQADLICEVTRVERAIPDPVVDDPERELVAQALVVSPLSAANRVHHALTLRERLPAVWHALRLGRISVSSARVIAEETEVLGAEQAHDVAEALLPWAHTATPGQVRRRARRLAARADTRADADRHRQAHTRRRVAVQAEPDGMASLWWTADAATIATARDLIDSHARANPVPEGIDAARSDALGALLLTADCHQTSSGARPVVAVHIELGTLLGADDSPCEVPGLGHVPADVARRVASDSGWRAFLHSADGQLAAVATRAYTPTPAMAALVVARDRTCRFPGCAQPAHRCDLDHRQPYDHTEPDAGGPTHPENLQALCRRHHNLKTRGLWTVQVDHDGTLHWTGPHDQRARVEHDPDPPW